MKDRIENNPTVTPFQFHVPDSVLDAIWNRVADYPWHEMPDDGGWGYGTNLDYLKELCAYWVDGFDWACARGADQRLFKLQDTGWMALTCISSMKKAAAPIRCR